MFDSMSEAAARQVGSILHEGKTKIITKPDNDGNSDVISKNDITAGDGAKHDVIEGKAALANQTTCNVFRLLQASGIPVAFNKQVNSVTFNAPLCTMLPYEVVVRREAHGSYLKRMPMLKKGHLFPKLLVEFFLKTNNKKWKDYDLPCDDPFMRHENGKIALYLPSKPIHSQEPFQVLEQAEVFSHPEEFGLFQQMTKIAQRVFLILEKAWQLEGRKLVDFKVEFGLDKEKRLLLADVIDNDSWRVVENGVHIDKQSYRDGEGLNEVTEKYRRVARITGNFRLPVQQIVIWRGSNSDNVDVITGTLDKLCGDYSQLCRVETRPSNNQLTVRVHTRSIHKEPVLGLAELNEFVQEVPNTVVIAYIGRSNGAGPVLSASTTVPVFTVPESFKSFPDDAWSSLRTPSNVPVATILEPSNAALAALGVLALSNPLIYMFIQEQLETRLVNTIQL